MLKIDMEPITLKLLNKRTAHSAYIKHTQEDDVVLIDLIDHVNANYPLDHTLDSACRYSKLIQELLTNIGKICPSINNSREKLVVVTPKNKDKRVRFTEPITSSGNTITKTTSTSNLDYHTTEVPLRKTTALDNETSKPDVTVVYSQKPRKSKTNVPVRKSKVLKSVSANKKEPSKSWGSIVSDVPSSSLDECRSSKLFSRIWTPAAPSI
ncbi:hypothetical protein Tco_0422344 [Tanacetum coccineum]